MYETYRVLGEQREAELLREAQRLQAGQAAKGGRARHAPGRRLVSMSRSKARVLLSGLLGSTGRGREKPAPPQLDP